MCALRSNIASQIHIAGRISTSVSRQVGHQQPEAVEQHDECADGERERREDAPRLAEAQNRLLDPGLVVVLNRSHERPDARPQEGKAPLAFGARGRSRRAATVRPAEGGWLWSVGTRDVLGRPDRPSAQRPLGYSALSSSGSDRHSDTTVFESRRHPWNPAGSVRPRQAASINRGRGARRSDFAQPRIRSPKGYTV